jgi:hypothetical protein
MGSFVDLNRRVKAMHQVWRQATGDLTLEQVNHIEKPGVLTIGFSLVHYVGSEDRYISERLGDGTRLWESQNWADRVGGTIPALRRGTPMSVAESVTFEHYNEWLAYQDTVFARTEAELAALPDERHADVVFEHVPDAMKGGFIELLAGDGPVILGDLLDVVLYQHGIRHIGEIEHARALVGLGGVG